MRLKASVNDFHVEEVLRLPPPDADGPFAIYRLEKRGVPTLAAAARIASLLGVPTRDVHVAGLKDARARAAQVVSVKLPGREIPRPKPARGIALTPVHRAARSIAGGDIISNRFRVTVRDLAPGAADLLPARIEAVRRDGLANYFDDQRLGGASPERGFAAKLLSEGKAEEALRLLIARPSPKDPKTERLEKKLVAEKWGRWAELRRDVKGEAAPVVKRLAQRAGPLEALRALDPRLRALLVSQYQSWLWNEDVVALLRRELPRDARFETMYRGGSLVFWRTPVEDRDVPYSVFPMPAEFGAAARPGARRLVLRPQTLEAGPDEPDDLFPGRRKVQLKLELPRGTYATLVAKRLFYEPAPTAPPTPPAPQSPTPPPSPPPAPEPPPTLP